MLHMTKGQPHRTDMAASVHLTDNAHNKRAVCVSIVQSHLLYVSLQGQAKLKEQIEEAVKGHQGIKDELLKFPMSMGDPRLDKDHSEELCTVLDVVYSTQVLELAQSSRQALLRLSTCPALRQLCSLPRQLTLQ